jgi:hypothetical protein
MSQDDNEKLKTVEHKTPFNKLNMHIDNSNIIVVRNIGNGRDFDVESRQSNGNLLNNVDLLERDFNGSNFDIYSIQNG